MSSFSEALSKFVDNAGKEKKKRKKSRDGSSSGGDGGGGAKRAKSAAPIGSGARVGANTTPSAPDKGNSPRARVNFLVVGMQKAGTSWMYKMLESHLGVALSTEKEVHYWDMHKEKGKDDAWYDSQFPEDVEGKVVGEVTPDYLSMWMNRVAEIHKYNPKMKIIILYRDEVDRAWSAFLMWNRINKVEIEKMSEDEGEQ